MWADAALVMDGSYLYAVAVIVSCVAFMFLEHLAFQDALYFTLISTSTVGFGDYVPHTPEGKIFLCILLPVAIPVCCRNMYPLGTAAFSTARSLVGTLQSAEERRPSSVRTPLDEDSIGRKTYATCALALALVVAPGAYLCHRFLAMDYVDATYFMTTSVLTVGYGDIVPTTLKSQMLTAFYLMIGCGTALVAAEAIYLHEKAKVVRTTDLRKFIDQVVLQETCWDSSWAGRRSRAAAAAAARRRRGRRRGRRQGRSRRSAARHVPRGRPTAAAASPGGFVRRLDGPRGCRRRHLVALRKQFAALMLAAKAAAPAESAESAESARATDGGTRAPMRAASGASTRGASSASSWATGACATGRPTSRAGPRSRRGGLAGCPTFSPRSRSPSSTSARPTAVTPSGWSTSGRKRWASIATRSSPRSTAATRACCLGARGPPPPPPLPPARR